MRWDNIALQLFISDSEFVWSSNHLKCVWLMRLIQRIKSTCSSKNLKNHFARSRMWLVEQACIVASLYLVWLHLWSDWIMLEGKVLCIINVSIANLAKSLSSGEQYMWNYFKYLDLIEMQVTSYHIRICVPMAKCHMWLFHSGFWKLMHSKNHLNIWHAKI